MADESMWIERAQSAEARLKTLKDAYEPAMERVKSFKANFGIREKDNGAISIDFDKFLSRLGEEQSLELKKLIEQRYGVITTVASNAKKRKKAA